MAPEVVTRCQQMHCGTHNKKKISRRENLILIVCQYLHNMTQNAKSQKNEFLLTYNIFIFENHSVSDFNSYKKDLLRKGEWIHRLAYVRKIFSRNISDSK